MRKRNWLENRATVAATALLVLAAAVLPAQDIEYGAPLDEEELVELIAEETTFRTGTTTVQVPVTVKDRKGNHVPGLEIYDFQLFDNKEEQKITSLDVSFLPISMVICVESSGRVEGMIDEVQKTAILFTEMVLGEFGRAALISFDSRIRILQDFTNDNKELEAGLKRIRIGSEAVRLSDGVYQALRLLDREPERNRKVIVVISESQDTGSTIRLRETMRTAEVKEVMIYGVTLSRVKARLTRDMPRTRDPIPPGIVNARPTAPGTVATPTTAWQSRIDATGNVVPILIDLYRGVRNLIFRDPLAVLVRGTGGEDYDPFTSEGIEAAIVKIGEDLRSQYLLSYTPNNLQRSGLFHEIEVETNFDQLKLRYQPGYWYGPPPVIPDEPLEEPLPEAAP